MTKKVPLFGRSFIFCCYLCSPQKHLGNGSRNFHFHMSPRMLFLFLLPDAGMFVSAWTKFDGQVLRKIGRRNELQRTWSWHDLHKMTKKVPLFGRSFIFCCYLCNLQKHLGLGSRNFDFHMLPRMLFLFFLPGAGMFVAAWTKFDGQVLRKIGRCNDFQKNVVVEKCVFCLLFFRMDHGLSRYVSELLFRKQNFSRFSLVNRKNVIVFFLLFGRFRIGQWRVSSLHRGMTSRCRMVFALLGDAEAFDVCPTGSLRVNRS